MTNRFLISVAAAALIAGTGFANAQGAGGANKESGAGDASPRYASETRASNGATTPAVPRRSRPKRDQTSTAE